MPAPITRPQLPQPLPTMPPPHRPEIIAHRGVHGVAAPEAPENSLASMRAGISAGVDRLEFDVRRTRDGVLVVHHDARVENRYLGTRVSDLDYDSLPLLENGERIPTLDAALQATRGPIKLDVELKERGYERQVLDRLLAHRGVDDFVVKSFHGESVAAIRALAPDVRAGLLVYQAPIWRTLRALIDPANVVMSAARVGAHFVSPTHRLASNAMLDAAMAANIAVLPWTVNGEGRLTELLADRRVAGVITDRPDIALALRDGAGSPAQQGARLLRPGAALPAARLRAA